MIDLALDPSETRPARPLVALPARGRSLRFALLGLAGAVTLGGFGVAASTLMAGLAAPPPVRFQPPSRAAEWPDLKDGLPALAGAAPAKPPAEAKRSEPEAPPLRMASLPEPAPILAAPPQAPSAQGQFTQGQPANRQEAAAAEPPTKRLPTPIPVAPIGPTRQAIPLAPGRTAALQSPRAAETVRAREVVEAAPVAKPAPPVTPAAVTAAPAEKPARKVASIRKPPAANKASAAGEKAAPGAVVQSAAAESEETEVLGIKLPSLAPAGRKLKESVDALGEAMKSVF